MRQITLVEPGFFRTTATAKGAQFPLHPAYTKPDGVVNQTRKFIDVTTQPTRGEVPSGDTRKAAKRIHELSLLPEPPLRLILGKDALGYVRTQVQMMTENFDAYESWSEDLMEY